MKDEEPVARVMLHSFGSGSRRFLAAGAFPSATGVFIKPVTGVLDLVEGTIQGRQCLATNSESNGALLCKLPLFFGDIKSS